MLKCISMRKCISIAVILSMLSLLYYSCSSDTVTQPGRDTDSHESNSERLEENLRSSPEVQELLEISDEMIDRALKCDVSGRELMDAYMAKDGQKMAGVLGYSDTDVEELQNRLQYLRNSLFDKYQDLKMMVEESNSNICATCRTDQFAEIWDNYRAKNRSGVLSGASGLLESNVNCNYIKLTILIIGCALSGNAVFYFICAYVSLCASCSGGWVDPACAPMKG